MKNIKVMVYTAIFGENPLGGGYDDLIEISKKEKNVDYFCFTDIPNLKSQTWKIVFTSPSENLDNTRRNRKIKILGDTELEKNYDLAIYVDGNIEFKLPIMDFIKKECDLEHYDFFLLKHPDRDCIYEEAQVCKKMNKDSALAIDQTVLFLKKENYPQHFGLTANSFFVRKTQNKNIKKIQKDWWDMVKNFSKRDQLSFQYCLWKNNYKRIKFLDLGWCDNNYYFMHDHKTSEVIIRDLQNCIEDLKKDNEKLKNEILSIVNSKRYKMVSKACQFFNSFKRKKR